MEKAKKVEKTKPPYSLWSNIKFIAANVWNWDKPLLFCCAARTPIIAFFPLAALFLSKFVVEIVEKKASVAVLGSYILIISGVILLLNIINNWLDAKIRWKQQLIRERYCYLINIKMMDTDYENIENPQGQVRQQKAWNTVNSDFSGTQEIINVAVDIVSNIIGLVSYSALLFMLNPFVFIVLFIVVAANYFFQKLYILWDYKNRDNWIPIDRKLNNIRYKSGDFEQAKDIRLYNMLSWFMSLFDMILGERKKWLVKSARLMFLMNALSASFLICNGGAYAYLIYRMITQNLPVSDFVLYFGIITGFSGWLNGVISNASYLNQISLNLCDLREFLDMPDKLNRGMGIAVPGETSAISFKNVCFKYSGCENDTIKNISFEIKKGEKIALVGLNGAGKTTIVKLICGLYAPTGGDIFVDGNRIGDYNCDEYYKLFSVVFQDIHLMPVSIAKNIALCREMEIDHLKLKKKIALAGLSEKIEQLPEGINSILVKSVHENAVDLSGGEKQKLALARALYKDGHFIVLDEPTASLDPIAENQMYLKYKELTAGRTSVFISHRLSSTRFCDRIFFIEDGQIIEVGSHDELIAKGGKYAEVFNVQSHYYREDGGV